jgi:hypothetical protein
MNGRMQSDCPNRRQDAADRCRAARRAAEHRSVRWAWQDSIARRAGGPAAGHRPALRRSRRTAAGSSNEPIKVHQSISNQIKVNFTIIIAYPRVFSPIFGFGSQLGEPQKAAAHVWHRKVLKRFERPNPLRVTSLRQGLAPARRPASKIRIWEFLRAFWIRISDFARQRLTPLPCGSNVRTLEKRGANLSLGCGTKAESAARERGRPIEPAPGNAGEGNSSRRTLGFLDQSD